MAEIDAMGGYVQGAEQKLGLVNKAVDLEKRQFDLEQQKQNVEVQKFDSLMESVRGIHMTPLQYRGPMIEEAKQRAAILNVPVNPMFWQTVADDKNHNDVAKSLSFVLNLRNPKEKSAAMQEFVRMASAKDVPSLLSGLAQTAAAFDAKLNEDEMKMKGNKLNPIEISKLTNETISNLKKSHERQIATIDAVTDINSLGAFEDVRNNPYARDAVKVLYAKMQDPVTGVKEMEMNRVSGLGAGAYEKVSQAMESFMNGTGKLNEDQWKKILIVANVLGQKSQNSINAALAGRQEELAAAGVNTSSILNAVSRHTPYDFKKNFGEIPQGITGAPEKVSPQDIEAKRKEILQELRKSDPTLAQMSDQQLYQEMNRRAKNPKAGGRQ